MKKIPKKLYNILKVYLIVVGHQFFRKTIHFLINFIYIKILLVIHLLNRIIIQVV
ncbi:hypothetical protein C2G38_2074859 [Gigaspora rosea]|uniref:Uncharacterized protein n=1 Tax=Gigaspora rosea TaxID=44941 RepID=A0A397VJP0_9GLOM|nr:hypothetical protein C2G38_2074859 [Gigaspora rosea]